MTTWFEGLTITLEETGDSVLTVPVVDQAALYGLLRKLRDLHFMRCPRCGMEMQEVSLRGLAVDACFACGGVFLGKAAIDVIAAPQQKGIMAAILNWFSDETKSPVK